MMRPAVLSALVALAACGPAVKQVDVVPAEITLEAVGATARVEAVPRDFGGGAVPLPVRWQSSRPEVAEVDAAGRVTARKSGEAELRAVVGSLSAVVAVRVSIPSRAVIEPASVLLTGVPSNQQLRLRLLDDAGREIAARDPSWSSADVGVARVVAGVVSAFGPGQTQVTASAAGLTATAAVEVRLPPFAALRAEPARLQLAPGATAKVTARAVDAAGRPVAGVPVRYASSDERVVRVTGDGTVTAGPKGKARILATGGGRSVAVEVSVRK
ncbi:MAG: Ig-like domain-containing protein [Deltaproteobacteria bacterium]|nr:Ig-like domain-containing protein [Deltaproteobacteria bacterium]